MAEAPGGPMASYLREVKELRRQMAAIPQLSKKQKVTTEEIAHLPQTPGGESLFPHPPLTPPCMSSTRPPAPFSQIPSFLACLPSIVVSLLDCHNFSIHLFGGVDLVKWACHL